MKLWIPILILFVSVLGLCLWDNIYTDKVFNKLQKESSEIYATLQSTEITDIDLQNKIWELNKYWTKKMDTLCVSISRKDLQPISDYLQYLCASVVNQNQEDAITYSRLLDYNITGLEETTLINFVNLL